MDTNQSSFASVGHTENTFTGSRNTNVRTHRKLKRGIRVGLLILACAWIGVWFTDLSRAQRESAQARACYLHLERLAQAFQDYAWDHDGKLPKAPSWVDDLLPYVKDVSVFHCPSDPSPARCSYGMNLDVGGRSIEEVTPGSERTVLLFETAHPGHNPVGGKADVVLSGRHYKSTNPNPSPGIRLNRHSDLDEGAYYLFVAGWQPLYVLKARMKDTYLDKGLLTGKEADRFRW